MNSSSTIDTHAVGHPQLPSAKDERTVPFLRQLSEMLLNNDEVITFIPGNRLGEQTTLGKIVVHDRNRVQAEVLPIYFNHASFASLRRQLSYFSFVRVGKGRQGGVTYTNDSVVELNDILKLKRRTPGSKQMTEVASAVNNGMKNAAKTNQDAGHSSLNVSENNDSSTFLSSNIGTPISMEACPTAEYSGIPRNISPMSNYKSQGGVVTRNRNIPSTSTGKRHITRKRERCATGKLATLLYNNGIVPFIHLPTKKSPLTDQLDDVICTDEVPAKKARREGPAARAIKDNLPGSHSPGRMDAAVVRPLEHSQSDATSSLGTIQNEANFAPALAANNSAIHALLALGCN